ncbi:hypothetical protein PoB_006631000 [Plakobranchus ocellatus]|uniref:Uncharacterized protein n=1 Tax=Plakobranchus ocellatus TaxID=259542 RepID=A0AAV4D6P2_9GAST|nr:hypothetical protein PoB_006631000 [Plakobranchus ocellatus]
MVAASTRILAGHYSGSSALGQVRKPNCFETLGHNGIKNTEKARAVIHHDSRHGAAQLRPLLPPNQTETTIKTRCACRCAARHKVKVHFVHHLIRLLWLWAVSISTHLHNAIYESFLATTVNELAEHRGYSLFLLKLLIVI